MNSAEHLALTPPESILPSPASAPAKRRGRPSLGQPRDGDVRPLTHNERLALSSAGISTDDTMVVDQDGVLWLDMGSSVYERFGGGLFPSERLERKAAAALKIYWAYKDRSVEPLPVLARMAAALGLAFELKKLTEGRLCEDARSVLDELLSLLEGVEP